MKVPAVYLADPSVEPTDKELQALSRATLETALERRRIAEARFDAEMEALLEEGAENGARPQNAPTSKSVVTIRRPDGRYVVL